MLHGTNWHMFRGLHVTHQEYSANNKIIICTYYVVALRGLISITSCNVLNYTKGCKRFEGIVLGGCAGAPWAQVGGREREGECEGGGGDARRQPHSRADARHRPTTERSTPAPGVVLPL
ncbi:unnamed protein product, partial [Brenthis ino]